MVFIKISRNQFKIPRVFQSFCVPKADLIDGKIQ